MMVVHRSNTALTVRAEVPCDSLIYSWLLMRGVRLDGLVANSRLFERAYLSWETVRMTRNPFFVEGTGFEGYFVGVSHSADEVLSKLLALGHRMIANNFRLYRFEYSFRSALMKTLVGEANDPKAVDVWSAVLGAAVARLRINLYYNMEADKFHTETRNIIYRLPNMAYEQHDHMIEQEYALALSKEPFGNGRSNVSLSVLKPSDYEAGLVVWSIGRFGHPLVREYLREANHSA